jgi:hypothetical protein
VLVAPLVHSTLRWQARFRGERLALVDLGNITTRGLPDGGSKCQSSFRLRRRATTLPAPGRGSVSAGLPRRRAPRVSRRGKTSGRRRPPAPAARPEHQLLHGVGNAQPVQVRPHRPSQVVPSRCRQLVPSGGDQLDLALGLRIARYMHRCPRLRRGEIGRPARGPGGRRPAYQGARKSLPSTTRVRVMLTPTIRASLSTPLSSLVNCSGTPHPNPLPAGEGASASERVREHGQPEQADFLERRPTPVSLPSCAPCRSGAFVSRTMPYPSP